GHLQLVQILGIEPFGDPGEADKVDEEYRHRAALLAFDARAGVSGAKHRAAVCAEIQCWRDDRATGPTHRVQRRTASPAEAMPRTRWRAACHADPVDAGGRQGLAGHRFSHGWIGVAG